MGGIFSSPSAPPMPEPQVAVDPGIEASQTRMDRIERNRRGRAGTILTSDRGLVSLNAKAAPKKSLLGE